MNKFFLLLPIITYALLISCSDDSKDSTGDIKGMVLDKNTGSAVFPANIYYEDSLFATTNESGEYEIKTLKEGTYSLLCSATDYYDTIQQIIVNGGKTTTHDFSLRPVVFATLIGEFQDLDVFNNLVETNPDLENWTSQDIFDAATGATISIKTLGTSVGDREVYLNDELIGTSDVWGQYGFNVPSGIYNIEGKCEGYDSKTYTLELLPGTKTYLNFFLEKE